MLHAEPLNHSHDLGNTHTYTHVCTCTHIHTYTNLCLPNRKQNSVTCWPSLFALILARILNVCFSDFPAKNISKASNQIMVKQSKNDI